MARIWFHASPEDQLEFREYIDSLGLFVFPYRLRLLGKTPSTAKDDLGGFISFLPSAELNPYRGYKTNGKLFRFKRQISEVTDPLTNWNPSYLMEYEGDRYIIQGFLEWNFNETNREPNRQEETKKGKYYFDKLCRWIRKNWPPPAKRHLYRGPTAQKLIQYEGYLPRSLPPNIDIEYVKI